MTKPVVLIGRADCWKQDLEEFKILCQEFDVMAIGLDCSYDGYVKYFATYHIKDLPEYIRRRNLAGVNTDFLVVGHKLDKKEKVDIIEPHVAPSGSSALLGTLAAIRIGYDKIILCGCPLIGASHNGFQPYNVFQKGWSKKYESVKNYTKSMSGWTMELLGKPDLEWLKK